MTSVAFDRDNFNKCLCGGCPVQARNACVQRKEEQLAPLKEDIERHARMPDPPQTVPGIYCSTPVGRSKCADLDESKVCLCPACPVFLQHELGTDYYCLRGSAEQVG